MRPLCIPGPRTSKRSRSPAGIQEPHPGRSPPFCFDLAPPCPEIIFSVRLSTSPEFSSSDLTSLGWTQCGRLLTSFATRCLPPQRPVHSRVLRGASPPFCTLPLRVALIDPPGSAGSALAGGGLPPIPKGQRPSSGCRAFGPPPTVLGHRCAPHSPPPPLAGLGLAAFMDVGTSLPFGPSPSRLSERQSGTAVGFAAVPRPPPTAKRNVAGRGGSGEHSA